MSQTVIPKKQLLVEIKRFFKDKDRGISIALFAELCGVDKVHLDRKSTRLNSSH